MSNHQTFSYPPGVASRDGRSARGGRTELVVTPDHARDAVRRLAKTLEFLRNVYCGPNGSDAFGVIEPHVSAAEDAPSPRPTRSHGSPSRSPPPPGAAAAFTGAAEAPRSPYDTIYSPASTHANPSLSMALHSALDAIDNLDYNAVLRKSGSKEANAVPFIVRIKLCKRVGASSTWFGNTASAPEVFEEWEFGFVKVKPTAAAAAAAASSSDTASSAIFRPTSVANGNPSLPSAAQHALGLNPSSLMPNDPAKLRDALHFINTKALEAVDAFVIDELRTTAEILFDVSVTINEHSTLCQLQVPVASVSATAAPQRAPSAEPASSAPSATAGVVNAISSFFRK